MTGPILIEPPAVEPVSPWEAKLRSRISLQSDEETVLFEDYLAAARSSLENQQCGIQLVAATYEFSLDRFPSDRCPILIPRPPLMEVLWVKYADASGVIQTLYDSTVSPAIDLGLFQINKKSTHTADLGTISLIGGQSWPAAAIQSDAITIRFRCGFGEVVGSPGEPPVIPAELKNWICIMAATMYEHREKEIVGGVVQHFEFVDGLLDGWRAKGIA